MQKIGEYSIKRRDEPITTARLILTEAIHAPEVSWFYNSDLYGSEIAYKEIEEFLLQKLDSIPNKPYSVTIMELGYGAGNFSLSLMLEVIEKAFENAQLKHE